MFLNTLPGALLLFSNLLRPVKMIYLLCCLEYPERDNFWEKEFRQDIDSWIGRLRLVWWSLRNTFCDKDADLLAQDLAEDSSSQKTDDIGLE